MKVVHVVPSVSHSTGGLFVSVSNLVRSSVAKGIDIYVFGPRGDESPDELEAWKPAKVKTFTRLGPSKFAYAPGLMAGLCSLAPDLIHAHGLWTFASIATARWSRGAHKQYLISIHGMLEPWALQYSYFRKRVARVLYQDAVIQGAACLRATSEMEADSIRAAGFRTPIAVVPNGVDLPIRPAKNWRWSERGTRQALFLSRLHPKKGVLNLVAAWSRLHPADWKLTIVGPEEAGYGDEVRAAIKAAGLERTITLTGPSWGEARFDYYWRADLFVLPSFSENFGLVVAEALACEVPVITTKGLPWREIQEEECGWWIDTGLEPLVKALGSAFALSDQQRAAMGARGRKLIAQNYTWESAARKAADVYRWLIDGGRPPDTIRNI